jgi:hypothetical protein
VTRLGEFSPLSRHGKLKQFFQFCATFIHGKNCLYNWPKISWATVRAIGSQTHLGVNVKSQFSESLSEKWRFSEAHIRTYPQKLEVVLAKKRQYFRRKCFYNHNIGPRNISKLVTEKVTRRTFLKILFPRNVVTEGTKWFLEEEAEDLSSEMLAPGFLVIHDAAGGRHHDVTEKIKLAP